MCGTAGCARVGELRRACSLNAIRQSVAEDTQGILGTVVIRSATAFAVSVSAWDCLNDRVGRPVSENVAAPTKKTGLATVATTQTLAESTLAGATPTPLAAVSLASLIGL